VESAKVRAMNTPDATGAATQTDPAAAPVVTAPPAPKTLCANCGAELHGKHCYACGQPVKGMIRPLSSMLHDVADTIFNIDSRIFRTLLPLYFRPGYLSNEYFAGRRVRYVTPFRLYFFLSVAAFLLIQWSLDSLDMANAIHSDAGDKIVVAQTPQEVLAARDLGLAEIEKAKAIPGFPAAAVKGMDNAADVIRRRADKRIAYLERSADAKAKGETAPPAAEVDDEKGISIGLSKWDAVANPVHISWLPEAANAKLTKLGVRARDNVKRINTDPKPFIIGVFGVLPQVLFVLMPLFALLLKIFYIFKRRLYMEHLIIALHSHSFIFISLLLITLAVLAHGAVQEQIPWLYPPLGLLIFVMCWWVPIYLFLMQKKVYKQGWFFTTLKFCIIGVCYTIMISLGAVAALLVSLATT
jgi:Protein of unknown function (DUF3667)